MKYFEQATIARTIYIYIYIYIHTVSDVVENKR